MNLHSGHAHLGDCIWALTMLSRLPGQHEMLCKGEYVPALRELVEGLPISIEPFYRAPSKSYDFWIASGLFEHRGVRYQDNIDILGFVARYFNAMAEDAGHSPVFNRREDLLCDFPSISERLGFNGILIINCDPKSGQCPRYSSSEMDELVCKLDDKNPSVLAVEKASLSLAQIGALSSTAKLIIGCATGPWWPCQNVWNATTQRICMLDPMRIDYGSVPIVHAPDAAHVETILEGMGYL